MDQSAKPKRVFISYANEPREHGDQVRNLWLFLRRNGIDARWDLSATSRRQDWAIWMADEVREADHVLVVASPAYRERAEGRSSPDSGRGVQWEARLIRDAFYRDQRALTRFVPVVLPGQSAAGVPDFLAPNTCTVYHVEDFTVGGAEGLLRLLLSRPAEIEPALGTPPVLQHREHTYSPAEALPKGDDRGRSAAAVGEGRAATVFGRQVRRFRSAWSERRESNIRRRLLTWILPSFYDHLSPTWLAGRSVAVLPVPSSYQALFNNADLTKASLADAARLETSDLSTGYRRSGHALLVLGKAGAGKTRALSQLLRDLTALAAVSREEPVPFYLHLSTWDGAKGGFDQWCARAIAERYSVPQEYAEKWLVEVDIALVLDGLDELPIRRRTSCISAINKFTQEHGQVPLVVACRTEEYLSARRQVRLRGCQQIHPLDTQGLLAALENLEASQTGLRQKVLEDSSLRQLLRTPLFLQLGLLAYQGVQAEDIVQQENGWQSTIISSYFDQAEKRVMVAHPQADIGLSTWLPGLAVRLRAAHHNVFYPDRLPISLLDENNRRKVALHTAIAAVILTLVVLAVVRIPLLLLGSSSEYFAPYAYSAIVGSFFTCLLSWKIGRRALDEPPASRRTVFKTKLKRATLRWSATSSGLGALASLTPPSPLWAMIVMLASIFVAVSPSAIIMRSTESRGPDELPEYPGHEARTLLMCSLSSAAFLMLTIGATLTFALELINNSQQLTMLPTAAMLPYFVVLLAVPAALLNGGAELLSRLVARRVLARSGRVPKQFMQSFHQLQLSSILTQSLGGYEFVHVLVRDELVRRSVASSPLR